MIDIEQLASNLNVKADDLKYFITQFKYYLRNQGVRLELRGEWVVNIDKI